MVFYRCRFSGSFNCRQTAILIVANHLLTGFVATSPAMIYFTLSKRQVTAEFVFEKFAIGEGATIATAVLNYRAHDILHMPLDKACYLAYEAKTFSESVGSVGQGTRLTLHAPLPEGANCKQWCGSHITDEGLAKLEMMRERLFIQPLAGIDQLWPSFFDQLNSPIK